LTTARPGQFIHMSSAIYSPEVRNQAVNMWLFISLNTVGRRCLYLQVAHLVTHAT
jgi:hypothetical protein